MEKHREKLACRDLAEQGHYPIGTDSIEQIRELLEMLVSDDLDEGLTNIEVLGEIGDEGALKAP